MTVDIRHRFRTPRAGGPPLSRIQPEAWNEAHVIEAEEGSIIGRHSAGQGPAQEITLGVNFTYSGGQIRLAPQLSTGTLTLENALPIASGGTGAGTAAQARANLQAELSGAVVAFAGNTAPPGFLKANGAAVSRTTYATLFSRIGTSFGGGDGSTTFNLPDLRGEFLRGWDDGRGVDGGRGLGSFQDVMTLNHSHAASFTTSWDGDHTHGIYDAVGLSSVNNTNARWRGTSGRDLNGDNRNTDGAGGHNHTFGVNTNSTGSGTEFRPRNIAMLICIKF